MCCNNNSWNSFGSGIDRDRVVHGDCLYHTSIGEIKRALERIERSHTEIDRGIGLFAGCVNGQYFPVGPFVGRNPVGVPFGNSSALCGNSPACTSSPMFCEGPGGWDGFRSGFRGW